MRIAVYHLTVVHEFGSYSKGQRITDEAEVLAVLASHNHTHVVKTLAPEPAPTAPPEVAPLTPAGA